MIAASIINSAIYSYLSTVLWISEKLELVIRRSLYLSRGQR